MRLFIAVGFEKESPYLKSIQEKLHFQNSKLTFPKTFHLTLKFLGEVAQDKAEKIKESLNSIKSKKFHTFLDSIGVFPGESYIRVVWVGLNPKGSVLHLQKSIDAVLSPLFKKEKDFKAHITLARVKFPEDKKSFVEQVKNIKAENKGIEIKDFRLVKSTLTSKGHVYEDLEVFSLNQETVTLIQYLFILETSIMSKK